MSEEKGLKVYVEVELDDKLRTEGLVRDVVRRIQTMRKDLELGYTQKIKTYYDGDEILDEAVNEMEDYIKKETLSRELKKVSEGHEDGFEKDWSIDGNNIKIWVDPIEDSEDQPLNI